MINSKDKLMSPRIIAPINFLPYSLLFCGSKSLISYTMAINRPTLVTRMKKQKRKIPHFYTKNIKSNDTTRDIPREQSIPSHYKNTCKMVSVDCFNSNFSPISTITSFYGTHLKPISQKSTNKLGTNKGIIDVKTKILKNSNVFGHLSTQ